MSVQNVWTYFLMISIIGWIMPSIRVAHLYINLCDKCQAILFPVRTLANRIVGKNDLVYAFTNIRTDKGVNAIAVIWQVIFDLAVIVFAVLSLIGNLTALKSAFLAVLYAWIILLIPFIVGLFLGDRKYKKRVHVSEADSDSLHAQEQLLAFCIDDNIEEYQEKLAKFGYHWRIDVLCTDRLEDEPNATFAGAIASLSGVAQTNPFYMSRVVVTLMDEENEPVPFPVKRRNEREFAFTQGVYVTHFLPEYLSEPMIDIVRDMTAAIVKKNN
ncbi:MAG: hypothetical protein J6L88_06175 [Clostridia bacterium]|nr:hypothetical protein [Clostridia bacterium]